MVVFLLPTRAMISDDLYEPVKDCGSRVGLRRREVGSDRVAVRWMTAQQPHLQLTDGLTIAQTIARNCMVFPYKLEPPFGGPESAAKNVVERVEVVSPLSAGDHGPTDFVEEAEPPRP